MRSNTKKVAVEQPIVEKLKYVIGTESPWENLGVSSGAYLDAMYEVPAGFKLRVTSITVVAKPTNGTIGDITEFGSGSNLTNGVELSLTDGGLSQSWVFRYNSDLMGHFGLVREDEIHYRGEWNLGEDGYVLMLDEGGIIMARHAETLMANRMTWLSFTVKGYLVTKG